MSATTTPDDASTRTILTSSVWVAAGTAFSRATGLLRVAALTYAVGQTRLADLYTLTNNAPNVVYELVVGGTLSATLVPAFVKARNTRDDDATSALMSVGLVSSVMLGALAIVLSFVGGIIAQRQFPDSAASIKIGTWLLCLLLPQVVFYGISTLCTSYLNAARRYRTAAFAPTLTNIFTTAAFIIVGSKLQGRTSILSTDTFVLWPLMWLALGTTGGIALMTIPVLVDIRRMREPLRLLVNFRHQAVRNVTKLSLWTIGYVASNQVALAAVYTFAYAAAAGTAKRYNDAFIFFQLPHGLIAVSIMTTMTPELASSAANGDYQGLADRFARGLRLMAVLIIPAAGGYMLLGTPIASMLLGYGSNFTATDAARTGSTVAAFAVGLPAFSAYLFANRGFYAMSDARTPFFTNLFENALNVIGIVGITAMGFKSSTAFALTYSFAYVVAAAIALRRFEQVLRQREPNLVRPDLAPIGKMVVATAAMMVAVFSVRLVAPGNDGAAAWLSVGLSVAVGLAVYVGVGHALAVEEIRSLTRSARRVLPGG